MMIEPTLFSVASTPEPDLGRTGGLPVAVDETFATAARIQLDETSWVDHVPGWLAGDDALIELLTAQACVHGGRRPGERGGDAQQACAGITGAGLQRFR